MWRHVHHFFVPCLREAISSINGDFSKKKFRFGRLKISGCHNTPRKGSMYPLQMHCQPISSIGLLLGVWTNISIKYLHEITTAPNHSSTPGKIYPFFPMKMCSLRKKITLKRIFKYLKSALVPKMAWCQIAPSCFCNQGRPASTGGQFLENITL